MATAKNILLQQEPVDENRIITFYMDDVTQNDGRPMNVYRFIKEHQIPETEFYRHFSSLEHLQQKIWVKFFDNAVSVMRNEPAYATYELRNKLLTLYFTLFEILALNRSYALFALKENGQGLQNLAQLRKMRNVFKAYVEDTMAAESRQLTQKIRKFTDPAFAEGAWLQFLFLLKFWLEDTSAGLEKTDILIEKSVNTVMDFLDTKPLENLFDLGKFLWKEGKSR